MKVRLIATLLLISVLLGCLVGCGGTPEETTTTASGGGEQTPPKTDQLVIAEDGKSEYKIVYPIQSGNIVQAEAENLATLIEDVTGTKMTVMHDSMSEAEHEIRIGYVKRMSALDVYKNYNRFKERDFAVTVVGNHIYIYGDNAQSIKSAMIYFTEKVLSKSIEDRRVAVAADLNMTYVEGNETTAKLTGSDENYVYFTIGEGTLGEAYARISYTGNNAWRLQTKASATAEFNDIGASQRLALSLGEAPKLDLKPITVTQSGDVVTAVAEDGSTATLNVKNFEINFYKPSDTQKKDPSATVTSLSTSQGGSSISGKINANEGIFGTGERFDSANQRGKKINMFSKDIWSRADACYMVIPLLCFTRGSGIFFNIYEEMNLNLGEGVSKDKEATWYSSVIGASMDCYFYTTEYMSEAINGYSYLSGYAEMPEEWTYGMLICRYGPELKEKWTADITPGEVSGGRKMGVYDAIAYMEEYDLPWTGILAEGWGPYNDSKHQDLEELCDYVHSLGKKFLVYMRVGWAGSSQDGFVGNFLVSMTKPNGQITDRLPAAESNNPDTGGATDAAYPYLDITNPFAVEWFFNDYWKYLSEDVGVDGCKIDFCETLPEYYELNYYDENMPTSGSHHWYPSAFCAMFWDMISSKPDSGMCYTRGGGIGAQRAPYMWAGDQARCYASLEFQLTACLSSGVSGVPFMSYDMSGYQYGNESQDPYYEGQVFVRGTQFTAFTICMQQHGKVRQAFQFSEGQKKMQMVKKADGTFSHWEETDEWLIRPGEMTYVTDIYRGWLKLHELLTPYITEYSEEACTTGMPIMRILALNPQWQDDVTVYDIDDEYMFGDSFLVAPILDNSFARNVYLPEGNWKDLNTGRTYEVGAGGMTVRCPASLAQMPVFYNLDTTSQIAPDLLAGIEEIFEYLNSIQLPAQYRAGV